MDEQTWVPKFRDADRPSVNFQLFPPHSGTEETHARHGNGRANGFSSIQIPLENHAGAELIFRATIRLMVSRLVFSSELNQEQRGFLAKLDRWSTSV